MNLKGIATWLQEHPVIADALLVLVLLLPTFGGQLTLQRSSDPAWPFFLWAASYIVPLMWRRTHADLVGLAVIVPHVIQLILGLPVFDYLAGQPVFGNVAAVIVVYTAAIYSTHYRLWLGVGMIASALAGVSWGMTIVSLKPQLDWLGVLVLMVLNAIPCALLIAVAWTMGRLAYHRAENAIVIKRQMEALQREREQARDLAIEQERTRIARDMHDVIAHSLSVIIVQADGAQYLLDMDRNTDPKASAAVGVIGNTARHALSETRRLVGVLRDDAGAQYQPTVGLADISGLVKTMRDAGLNVTLHETGNPTAHAEMSSGAEAAAYRIVQESLTNVMKHAGDGAAAWVEIDHNPGGLRISIRDDGIGVTRDDGLGHGIIGMRERVEAFDGTLEAGPRMDGGFHVVAVLPAGE